MICIFRAGCKGQSPFQKIFLLYLIIVFSVSGQVEKGLLLSQGLAAGYNPIGLLLDTRLFYRAPILKDTGILWKTTKIDAGLINEWSPADDMLGIAVNIEPIAVLDVTFKAGVYKSYPLLGFGFRRLSGPGAAVDDQSLKLIAAESRWGTWISAAPTLKVKIAPVIVANTVTVNRIDMGDTNKYFHEIRSGLAHRFRDFDVTNDLYVLFERDSVACAGLNYNFFWVRSTREQQQKLGAILIVTPTMKGLSKIYGVVTGGMYLQSRLYDGRFFIAAAGGIELKVPGMIMALRKK